ncbi:FAD binding domain-containing protein [Ilyonectria destructans]|nr:FAD binding domain-containing protein [Ilyonectria destructans]
MESIEVDVLVCGGGMSGMSCANHATGAGAKVLVAEKQGHVGGSSAYSAGMFWAPETYEKLRSWVPDGDANLQRAWLNDYPKAVQWMRDSGIPTADKFGPIMTIGIGYPIKIPDLYRLHAKRIEESSTGSKVWTNTKVVKILQQEPGVPGSRVTGAILQCTSPDGTQTKQVKVEARCVVLATGGFQGSSELKARYLSPSEDNLFVRANTGSVGDGLRLAASVGANTSRGMATYYGHLMAAPLRQEDVSPKDYLPLAQYQSRRCLLLNERGKRFADETTGDEIVNQHLAKQDNHRGFLVFNEETRLKYTTKALFPNSGDIDRVEKARQSGCNVAESRSLEGILQALGQWGVDVARARQTIEQYYRHVGLGDRSVIIDAPVGRGGEPPEPLVEGDGPFYAMEVQPSITFTYGGIEIDSVGHALGPDKAPIPGLLVAGVDAGGFSNLGYAGGLALAFVTGYWAAREICNELKLPLPFLPRVASADLSVLSSGSVPSNL